MAIRMARPTTRLGSSAAYYRKRVPSDLTQSLRGKVISLDLPCPEGSPLTVSTTISAVIQVSLRTSQPSLVKLRQGSVSHQVETYLERARTGSDTIDLSYRDVMALVGVAHQQLLDQHSDNPPASYELEVWADMINHAQSFDLTSLKAMEAALDSVMPILDARSFVRHHCETTLADGSFRTFVNALLKALVETVIVLRMRSHGDYSPDTYSTQYPRVDSQRVTQSVPHPVEGKHPRTSSSSSVGVFVSTLQELFDVWRTATSPSASTVSTWQGYINRLTAFVGHSDPHKITKQDAQGWRDALVKEGRKVVNRTYLGGMRTMYQYALDNSETTGIKSNPFDGVKARQKVVAGTSRLPFSDTHVRTILDAALTEHLPHLRWLPWLQASTGARVGELAQLWTSNVITEPDTGLHCLHILPSPDGGSLKNVGSERVVPIHPTLIEMGFLDFVSGRKAGPLFYGKPALGRAEGSARKHPSKGVSNRLSEWTRGLGIDDPRLAPNHSFRHWFKTALRKLDTADSLVDQIQGHAARSEGDAYRHADPRTMLNAVEKLSLKTVGAKALK